MNNSFGYQHGSDASSLKRARAGSISGRLRAASDLEEIGLIDRAQKGVLKDLIITGDAELQNALDKYSRGDTSELEGIIKSGTLSRKQSLDLLDGLDLDFLNVYRKDTASNLDDFNIEQSFDDDAFRFRGMSDMNPDMFRGSFDFGAPPAATSKRTLSTSSNPSNSQQALAPQQNSYSNQMNSYSTMPMPYDPYMSSGMGGGLTSDLFATSGEVDMFAYERMAQSLQQQPQMNQMPRYGNQPPQSYQSGADNNRPFSGRPASSSMMQHQQNMRPSTANNTLVPSSNGGYSSNPLTLPKARPQDGSERGYIGAYSPESRRERIERFIEKRKRRVWTKKVKYDVRKNFADSRLRVKGRFVKKEDEELLRELMSI